ncbi:MAG: c-type cytochrome, partial [Pseudomonadota bacterium]
IKDGSGPPRTVLLSGSFDYTMQRHDLRSGRGQRLSEPNRFDAFEGAVNAVAFATSNPGGTSPDVMAAAGDDGKLWLYALGNGRQLASVSGHTAKINHIDVLGARLVTSSWDRSARIWTIPPVRDGVGAALKLETPVTLEGHRGPVTASAFSADGAFVFTASSDGNLRKFDARTGDLKRIAYKHGWGLNMLQRIPGTRFIAFGATDGAVGLFHTEAGTVTKTLAQHTRPVLALAVAGARLATAGGDGIIRVWSTATWERIEEYKNPFGPIWALAFSADGKTLFYGGLDDKVHVWQVTPRKPFEPVASAFPRRFQKTASSDDPIEIGRIQFARKCSVCHTLTPDGANRAGPTLHKIFGRKIATHKGYRFSEPLKKLDIVWTPETVSKLFELGPDVFTPGSKMPLQKMTDPKQRDALIAFLKQATEPSSRNASGSN